jgi:hypothetical protein
MKRIKVLVGALACSAVLLSGSNALAANPHFTKNSPKFVATADSVIASGKVVGLGKTVDGVDIVLDATAKCQNPAGNDPPGLRRSATGGFFKAKNGSVSFSLEASFRDCPGPHDLIITGATLSVDIDGDGEADLTASKVF